MKKFIAFILVVLLSVTLASCGQTTTEAIVANDIEQNMNRLNLLIKNMDTVSNTDLSIENVSSSNGAKSNNVSNRLKNSYGTLSSANRNNRVKNVPYKVTNTATNDNNNYENSNNYYDNLQDYAKNTIDSYKQNLYDKYVIPNEPDATIDNYDSQKVIDGILDKYKKDNNIESNQDILDRLPSTTDFLNKWNSLCNLCNSCVQSNQELNDVENEVKSCMNTCSNLCDELRNGNITLSEIDVDDCYNACDEINSCISNLSSNHGGVNKCKIKIDRLKYDLTNNIDNLTEQYQNMLDSLNKRIENLDSCRTCFDDLVEIITNPSTDIDYSYYKQSTPTKNIVSNTASKIKNRISKNNNSYKAKNYATKRFSTKLENSCELNEMPIRKKKLEDAVDNSLSLDRTARRTRKYNRSDSIQNRRFKTYQNSTGKQQSSRVLRNDSSTRSKIKRINGRLAVNSFIGEEQANLNNYSNTNTGISGYNNSNSGINNGINYSNGYYNNGYNTYNNGYPRINIDSYRAGWFSKNIDTYKIIYTNIDTYKKDYIFENRLNRIDKSNSFNQESTQEDIENRNKLNNQTEDEIDNENTKNNSQNQDKNISNEKVIKPKDIKEKSSKNLNKSNNDLSKENNSETKNEISNIKTNQNEKDSTINKDNPSKLNNNKLNEAQDSKQNSQNENDLEKVESMIDMLEEDDGIISENEMENQDELSILNNSENSLNIKKQENKINNYKIITDSNRDTLSYSNLKTLVEKLVDDYLEKKFIEQSGI